MNVGQCSKLRVHPAPGVHNLAAGCLHFTTCAPGECPLIQSIAIHYISLYTRKCGQVHDFESLCTRCVQKIMLNLNTVGEYSPMSSINGKKLEFLDFWAI